MRKNPLDDKLKQPIEKNTKYIIAKDLNFIILPYGTDKSLLQKLREEFNYCIFIVLTGQDNTESWDLPQFLVLEPALEDGIHDQIDTKMKEAYYNVNCAFNEGGN